MDNSGNNDSWPANRPTIVMPNGQRQWVHSFALLLLLLMLLLLLLLLRTLH